MGGNRNRWQLAHLSISFKPSTLKFTEALGLILKRIFFLKSKFTMLMNRESGKIEQLLLSQSPMQYGKRILSKMAYFIQYRYGAILHWKINFHIFFTQLISLMEKGPHFNFSHNNCSIYFIGRNLLFFSPMQIWIMQLPC